MAKFKKAPIGIIGAGRVGSALGRALHNVNYNVVSISGQSKTSKQQAKKLLPTVPVKLAEEVAREAKILILAVPDDNLASLIKDLDEKQAFKDKQYVLHTSGSKGLAVFDNVKAGIRPIAFHPAMTFTGARYDVRRLRNATYGITVREDAKNEERLAKELVSALEGIPIMLTEAQRVLYHAGLTLSSNYLVTLVAESFSMLEQAGLPEPKAVLEPLLTAALGNVLFDPKNALSGPISRGDVKVVKAHRKMLAATMPHLMNVYDTMGKNTVVLALENDKITKAQAKMLLQEFSFSPEA